MARKTYVRYTKIRTKMIHQKRIARDVAFAKRRSRLFKKAVELCASGSYEISIFVCSPDGKLFSFGQFSSKIGDLHEKEEAEKKEGAEIEEIGAESEKHCWWRVPIHELDKNDSARCLAFLEDLTNEIAKRLEELLDKDSDPNEANSIGTIGLGVVNP